VSDEILSKAELDSLLSGNDSSALSGRTSRESFPSVVTAHQQFARAFASALSGMLRTTVEVNLKSTEPATYREFVQRLENPTCFQLIRMPPLEGRLLVELNLAIVFPMIDRLLGGSQPASFSLRRPLTEIELRLVARVTESLLQEYQLIWPERLNLHATTERVDSNPGFAQAMAPEDKVLQSCFEIKFANQQGSMNVCFPRGWASRLVADRPVDTAARENSIELVAELAETKINAADLAGLEVGDVITTEQTVGSPITLRVDGVAKYRGKPGATQGRKAVRVEEVIAPPESPSE
jgi:flagellar motor switch protein FliM